jgi:hypothetical protein
MTKHKRKKHFEKEQTYLHFSSSESIYQQRSNEFRETKTW